MALGINQSEISQRQPDGALMLVSSEFDGGPRPSVERGIIRLLPSLLEGQVVSDHPLPRQVHVRISCAAGPECFAC